MGLKKCRTIPSFSSAIARVARIAAASALVLAAAANGASAQGLKVFSWQPLSKVYERMERDHVPAIIFFESYHGVEKDSFNWNFSQPQIQQIAREFACCKIQGQMGSSRMMYGSNQKLAEKYGVGTTSTLVFLAYDGEVLGTVSSVVKRDELQLFLKGIMSKNEARKKANETSSRDLDQVEKWIEEGRLVDAVRRRKMVAEREGKIDPKIIARANEIDEKLKKICLEKVEEAKKLADDPARREEAKATLKEITVAFGSYEEAKAARDLLKKLD